MEEEEEHQSQAMELGCQRVLFLAGLNDDALKLQIDQGQGQYICNGNMQIKLQI